MDAQTVWQCNVSNTSVSNDGGKTWENVGKGLTACIINAADAKTAWTLKQVPALKQVTLELTADRGKTWNKITLPKGIKNNFEAISLRTASDGYVLTSDGVLHKTQDGGKTWSSVTLDMTKYDKMTFMPAGENSGSPPASAIRFFDADHGLVIMSLIGGGGSKVVALRTADGGQTWTEEAVPASIGTLHLTHDGKYLTVISAIETQKIMVLHYTGG